MRSPVGTATCSQLRSTAAAVMTCNKVDGIFSWQGQASLGGYIGADSASLFSAVSSGAAGTYLGTLTADAGINTVLTIQPGQVVSISGDPALSMASSWGSGRFTVLDTAEIALNYINSLIVEAGAGLIIVNGGGVTLDSCVVQQPSSATPQAGGHGIVVYSGSATIRGTRFENIWEGAMEVQGGSVMISNSQFVRYGNPRAGIKGGAIYIEPVSRAGTSVSIVGSIFDSNAAYRHECWGGAIYIDLARGEAPGAQVSISTTQFVGNTEDGQDYAIFAAYVGGLPGGRSESHGSNLTNAAATTNQPISIAGYTGIRPRSADSGGDGRVLPADYWRRRPPQDAGLMRPTGCMPVDRVRLHVPAVHGGLWRDALADADRASLSV